MFNHFQVSHQKAAGTKSNNLSKILIQLPNHVTILLSNILLYINTLTKYIFVDIVYATFTRIGCNTTPSIPSANAFGNTFFIICILPFTSALIFMPLLLTNNPL